MTFQHKIDDFPPGKVWLVGAGPGDPDLLTRKAERLITQADVIFYDALVGPDVLTLAHDKTKLIAVGKRAGRHSKDQDSINALLVEAAQKGLKIVRLKGGDPSIFGRVTEEMRALSHAGIAHAVCPGITAASAAAASIGTSLTLRGLARKISFVTAHARKGEILDIDWKKLADPEATLAVYMGKASSGIIARHLQQAGLSGDTPVIVIENASLPQERHFSCTLSLMELTVKTALGDGPALLLIGEAMRYRGDEQRRSAQIGIKAENKSYKSEMRDYAG